MKFPKSLRYLLVATTFAYIASAQSDETTAAPDLTLRQAVEEALARNLGLRIQRIDPEIAEESVIAQESVFDPALFTRASLGQSNLEWDDADGDTRQTISDSRSYSAGVSKRLATGTTVTASASHSRSDGSSFNPELNQLVGGGLSERASLSLQITQPLLRDFGRKVNLAPIRHAESQERAADLQTRNAIFDLLELTEIAYWRLADAYRRVELRQSNLELSERLLEEATERHEMGVATSLSILQAEANLAQRQEEIIRAQQAIREAADDLFAAMGLLDATIAIDAQPSVQTLPAVLEEVPEFDYVLQSAFERNFDTAVQEEILEQLEQERILARNNQRPEVDVTLSTSYNGLSPESSYDAFEQALDRRGDDWGLNLSFNLPWGSRAAKSDLRQTYHRIDQAEIQLMAIKQDLLRSVRTAWRDLRASREQLRAAELVVRLQEATFEQERSRLGEGLSNFRLLLETQSDLDVARLSLLDAKLNATEAEIRLARVKGTLLERYGLDWNEAPVDFDAP